MKSTITTNQKSVKLFEYPCLLVRTSNTNQEDWDGVVVLARTSSEGTVLFIPKDKILSNYRNDFISIGYSSSNFLFEDGNWKLFEGEVSLKN